MSERRGRGPIADAIGDARNKLIDEAWFGRRTADGPGPAFDVPDLTPEQEEVLAFDAFQHAWSRKPENAGALSPHLSFEDAWALREPASPQGTDTDPDLGFDR